MEVLIYNAKVYVERGVFAQAVLTRDGRIAAVGTAEELAEQAAPDAQRYDAGGRTVVPGFNDSHQHLYQLGENLQSVDLHGADSIAEVQRRARAFIAAHGLQPGSVLHGTGWNQDYFTDTGRLLTRQDLDEVSTEIAIILERACGHILTANTRAIALAGVTNGSTPPAGGAFDFDENGQLTGIFRENACGLLLRLKPANTPETIAATLRLAMRHAAAHGVTSVQTMDLNADNWQQMLAAYAAVQKDPTLRVYHQCNFQEPEGLKQFIAAGHKTGEGDEFTRIGPLKMFVDGSLGARTALMRAPYHDDPTTSGIATMTPEELNEMVRLAAANGVQIAIHAIGDGAIERVLNSYDLVCEGANPLRHGIVHCQITDRALVQRFADNDTLAYVQPIFLHYDISVVEQRVGSALASTSYAFGTMQRMGLHMSFGTDAPVEDLDPIDNLYCAVNRCNLSGQPAGGFVPAEKLDIYDAVDAYTAQSAYASFEEEVKGRIRPGQYADLVVLSEDIFTLPGERLREAKVDATMVNGRFVYEREAQ